MIGRFLGAVIARLSKGLASWEPHLICFEVACEWRWFGDWKGNEQKYRDVGKATLEGTICSMGQSHQE